MIQNQKSKEEEMTFFNVFSVMAGMFLGLAFWLKIAVLAIATLILIPSYLWVGNKIGRRAWAFMAAAYDILMKFRNSFWTAYDLRLDDWGSFLKVLWPAMLCLMLMVGAVIVIIIVITRIIRFWGRLVKKCWQTS